MSGEGSAVRVHARAKRSLMRRDRRARSPRPRHVALPTVTNAMAAFGSVRLLALGVGLRREGEGLYQTESRLSLSSVRWLLLMESDLHCVEDLTVCFTQHFG